MYHSNSCGDFKIIEELAPKKYPSGVSKRVVKVQFIDTGYTANKELLYVLKGEVTDPYANTVLGVACLGELDGLKYTKAEYDIWYHMIRRCYCKEHPQYKLYGGVGIRVDDRWLCLANFIRDLPLIPGYTEYRNNYGNTTYQLDKDLIQSNIPKNQRVYSVNTCIFLPSNYNNSIRSTEYKKSHNCSSDYYGLYVTPHNTYQCSIFGNNTRYFIGTFDNDIAAANAYNWYASYYGIGCTFNQVPYMAPIEWTQHKTRTAQMCHIVDKK